MNSTRPVQLCHFRANQIWQDGPFKRYNSQPRYFINELSDKNATLREYLHCAAPNKPKNRLSSNEKNVKNKIKENG